MKVGLVFAAAGASAMSLDMEVRLFQEWKLQHGKTYESEEHELERFSTFKNNAAYIHTHNLGDHGFELGLNQFADMTNEEYKAFLSRSGSNPHKQTGSSFMTPSFVTVPDSVDWRTKDVVNAVKDQGQCGSCWAFSAVASLEGQYARKNGDLVSLSEQQLVDCSGSFGNQGCSGGLMDQAFEYIESMPKGLALESGYPYTAQDGQCRINEPDITYPDPEAIVTGYTDVASGDESALTNATATVGPISVAIDASHMSFQFYSSGVYYEAACSAQQLDHGVAVVGYGTVSGDDFYIVRNSWGEGWGQKGYINMSRNRNNNCGIATSASYPLV